MRDFWHVPRPVEDFCVNIRFYVPTELFLSAHTLTYLIFQSLCGQFVSLSHVVVVNSCQLAEIYLPSSTSSLCLIISSCYSARLSQTEPSSEEARRKRRKDDKNSPPLLFLREKESQQRMWQEIYWQTFSTVINRWRVRTRVQIKNLSGEIIND
jgi:hypothetical protein